MTRRNLIRALMGVAVVLMVLLYISSSRCPPQCMVIGNATVIAVHELVDTSNGAASRTVLASRRVPLRGTEMAQGSGEGVVEGLGRHVFVERFFVQTSTVPSFLLATLDPNREGKGGPSADLHEAGFFEAEVTDSFRSILSNRCNPNQLPRDNPIVVDLGVNIGYFANYAAAMGCRVVGVEPNPGLLDIAYATAILNGWINRLRIEPRAATAKRGDIVHMSTRATCPSCASVADDADANLVVEGDTVAAMVANDEGPIAFLKIDIDGLEIHALEGAMPLFRSGRVEVLYVEYNPRWWARGGHAITLQHGVNVLREILDCGYESIRGVSGFYSDVSADDLSWIKSDMVYSFLLRKSSLSGGSRFGK